MARIDDIRKEAEGIQKYLECNLSGDINEMLDRLDTLGVYHARSGALQAEVKGMASAAIARAMGDNKELIATLSASLVAKYLKGVTADIDALEAWLDNINSSCRQQCDNLRTIISYEKSRANI